MNSRHDAMLQGGSLGMLPNVGTTASVDGFAKFERSTNAVGLPSDHTFLTGQLCTSGPALTIRTTSLADHIEQRACRMQADLDRLKRIKAQISKDGILNVPMDDLRFAMSN